MNRHEALLKSLNLPVDIEGAKQIKEHVYYLEGASGQFILKLKRNMNSCNSLAEKVLAFLDVSFRREVLINMQIMRNEFLYLNAPKLISTDEQNYMLFEFIPGIDTNIKEIKEEKIVMSLIELQDSSIKINDLLIDKIMSVVKRPIVSLVRGIFTIVPFECGLLYMLKAMRIAIYSTCQQPPLSDTKLLHKDLEYDENYIISKNKEIYLIDFAEVVAEKRWIMLDIVDLSFNLECMKVNFNLIKAYYYHLTESQDVKIKIDLKAQVRIALMRKLVYYAHRSKYTTEQKKVFRNFLCNTILNDSAYNEWFEEMAGDSSF